MIADRAEHLCELSEEDGAVSRRGDGHAGQQTAGADGSQYR
jgi:hypothetical protein